MILDDEEDRAILLQLIEQAAFTGRVAETVVRLKNAIREAKVELGAQSSEQAAAPKL